MATLVTGVCPDSFLSFPKKTCSPLFLRKQPCRAHTINIYGGDTWKEDALTILLHVLAFLIFEKSKILRSRRHIFNPGGQNHRFQLLNYILPAVSLQVFQSSWWFSFPIPSCSVVVLLSLFNIPESRQMHYLKDGYIFPT